jgi:hypothetical protein
MVVAQKSGRVDFKAANVTRLGGRSSAGSFLSWPGLQFAESGDASAVINDSPA